MSSETRFQRMLRNSWFKTFVAGTGFLSDSYDLFVIDTVNNILKILYGQSAEEKAAISNAALVGSVLGQVFFGVAGDFFGRKWNFVITSTLIIFGALLSAAPMNGQAVPLWLQLCILRGILGFGVGGEYPLSATMTSESATNRSRGRAMASVFAMQGFGKLLAACVDWLVVARSDHFVEGGISLDGAWRFALAFGAVPSLLTILFRILIDESHHYKATMEEDRKEREAEAAAAYALSAATTPSSPSSSSSSSSISKGLSSSKGSYGSVADAGDVKLTVDTGAGVNRPTSSSMWKTLQVLWEFKWTLVGTASTWFLLDVTFYGQGLMNTTVVQGALFGEDTSLAPIEKLERGALGSLAVVAIALPGYLLAIAFIDRMGRWWMQVMGFTVSIALFGVLGGEYEYLRSQAGGAGFVIVYGLTYLFANFGANTTTFLMPAEAFPTRARASAHGISAAMGKIGATVGNTVLVTLYNSKCADGNCASSSSPGAAEGVEAVMFTCAGVCALGLVMTLIFVRETGGKALEDIDASSKIVSAGRAKVAAHEAAMAMTGAGSAASTPLSADSTTSTPHYGGRAASSSSAAAAEEQGRLLMSA